jgi:hypothetical protein
MVDLAKEEEAERKHRLRELSDRKNKIKNYKFDSIAEHVDRQRSPSTERKKRKK